MTTQEKSWSMNDEKKIPELPVAGELAPYDLPDLPECAHQKHLAPNTFLQTALFGMVRRGRRRYLEKKRIVSFHNMTVFFTGGELDQGDLDVFIHAVHLAAKQAENNSLNGLVKFSVRGYLKELGKQPGKSGQDWLLNSIRRLCACLVEVHFGDSKMVAMRKYCNIYGGPLIYDFYFDPVKSQFYLRVNSSLGTLFNMGWTPLKWHQRLKLKTGLSKWLHGLYSSINAYPMKVATLRTLSRSKCKRLSDFRTKLRKSLNELIEVGAIDSWLIDDEDKVRVTKQQKKEIER